MLKEESELVIVRKLNPGEFDKIKLVWFAFISLSMEETAAMYFSTDNETHALFDEGYDLSRELDILYDAALKMKIDGLEKGQDDIFAYCRAKEKAYEAKVHAANLEGRIQNVDLVEGQK